MSEGMFCGKCGCPEDKGHFDHCPEINPNYKWEVKPLQGPLGLIDYIHFRYRRTHDLIVETDIGHDPDDFFAVCYLVAAGVRVRAILVVPGDPDQIAIARLLCKELKLDIPIGASKLGRTKRSSGSIHHELLKRYGHTLDAQPDAQGNKVIEDVLALYPGSEFFVIGPVTSLGTYLREHPNTTIYRATMQGGFLPYNLHEFSCNRLPDFENKNWVPTFNLNGDRKGAESFISADIKERRFVGKNVCHTVLYDNTVRAHLQKPYNRAGEFFKEAMDIYLGQHDSKKFHDPTAAVCHLHPEIGNWVRGRPVKMESGWSTQLDPNGDYVLASIDYDRLWHHISNWY